MSDIIFEYVVPDTNWLNPVWARYERKRRCELKWFSRISLIEMRCPNSSCADKAKVLGISKGYYLELKSKMRGEEKCQN